MRRKGLVGAGALALVTMWVAAPAAASVAATAPAAITTVLPAKRVTISLSEATVRAHHVTSIRVQLAPREPGRTVYLQISTGKAYRNLAVATSDARGAALFARAFGTLGLLRLRPEVVATANEPELVGNPSTEDVISATAFVLPLGTVLQAGDRGPLVADLQRQLTALGYWLGAAGGYFGDATQQAVWALEKAARIGTTGVVGPQFVAALNAGTVPTPRTTTGSAIDVDLSRDLLEIVQNGQLKWILNTSTGGGYTYTQDGATDQALTPQGWFTTGRVVDGTVTDSLGTLWRPRFFVGGYAIHGDTYVPVTPVSHGCVRVSNEAIDWIWANNLDPVGMHVLVY